jgi:hypothetical protein
LLTDEDVRTGISAMFDTMPLLKWKQEDGYKHSSLESIMLAARSISAMLDMDTEANRDALREWLPPPEVILRITEKETMWAAHCGASHPALLCARLYGERLGRWEAARDLAAGLLCNEDFQPLMRTEAYRQMGCALAALQDSAAANQAAWDALAEAKKGGYVWLQMLSLHDVLRCCGQADEADARSQLDAVMQELSAPPDEVEAIVTSMREPL